MKLRPILVTLSIATNTLLIAAVVLRPKATTGFLRDVFQPEGNKTTLSSATRAADAAGALAAQSARAAEASFAWSDFPSNDFSALVARLRAAGFPLSIVNSIVMTAVSERFAVRRRELMPNRVPPEYWKNPRDPRGDFATNLKTMAALRELDREQNRLLKELLGPDLNRNMNDVWFVASQRRQFGDLAPAKIDQLKKITTDYEELQSKVHEDSLGIILPEDRAKLALLEREKRADLERLLTPAELLDYELRNNPSAHEMRGRLGQFEATEEEFRALYAVQKAFDEKYSPRDAPLSPELARQRNDAQKQLEGQFQNVLGDARYADFKKANDSTFRQINDQVARLVARLELPPDTTATVESVQQDIQQRAAALRTTAGLSPDERNAQLASLGTEASDKLARALGPRGFEAYKQNGGQWLQTLARGPSASSGSAVAVPR